MALQGVSYNGYGYNNDVKNDNLQEQYVQWRVRGRSHLFKMGVIQLSLGGLGVLIGILTFVYGIPTGSFPFFLGAPLWAGPPFVIIAGMMGILASRQSDAPTGGTTTKDKCMVICHYTFSLLSLIISIIMPVFGGLGVFYCLNPGSTIKSRVNGVYYTTVIYCEPNRDANLALSGVALGLGILFVLFSIPFTAFFCCYARVYGFTSRQQQQQQIVQMQQQIASLESQVHNSQKS